MERKAKAVTPMVLIMIVTRTRFARHPSLPISTFRDAMHLLRAAILRKMVEARLLLTWDSRSSRKTPLMVLCAVLV